MKITLLAVASLFCFSGCKLLKPNNSSATEAAEASQAVYLPIADWSGRLELPSPEQRKPDGGVFIEIQNAPANQKSFEKQKIWLRYSDKALTKWQPLYRDVEFNDATAKSLKRGNYHPARINGLKKVSPLESLAGARDKNNMEVLLRNAQLVKDASGVSLQIESEPVQITGRLFGLVKFIRFVNGRFFLVKHWGTGNFNGPEEQVVVPASDFIPHSVEGGVPYAEVFGIEKSSLNPHGWYIYGDKNTNNQFVVRAMEPRGLTHDETDAFIGGLKESIEYVTGGMWHNAIEFANTSTSILLKGDKNSEAINTEVGSQHLVIHEFGNIGGPRGEGEFAGVATGHFAYGIARYKIDPISKEKRVEIEYKQVYAHNKDKIVAGSTLWQNYMGSLERGWGYTRPVADSIVFSRLLESTYKRPNGTAFIPLDILASNIEIMSARYRVGNGDGASNVSAVGSCVQDSNQMAYISLWQLLAQEPTINAMRGPDAENLRALLAFAKASRDLLTPLGLARKDWESNAFELTYGNGTMNFEGKMLDGLTSANTLFPRTAYDKINELYLRNKAQIIVRRSLGMGGEIGGIEPIPPESFLQRFSN